jgi:hypothetical protein
VRTDVCGRGSFPAECDGQAQARLCCVTHRPPAPRWEAVGVSTAAHALSDRDEVPVTLAEQATHAVCLGVAALRTSWVDRKRAAAVGVVAPTDRSVSAVSAVAVACVHACSRQAAVTHGPVACTAAFPASSSSTPPRTTNAVQAGLGRRPPGAAGAGALSAVARLTRGVATEPWPRPQTTTVVVYYFYRSHVYISVLQSGHSI